MSKVLNLEENEADQLADFLGHDIRIHREYYRLPEGTLQLAKMSNVLMAMEKGTLSDFKGKKLDDIEINPEEQLDPASYALSSEEEDLSDMEVAGPSEIAQPIGSDKTSQPTGSSKTAQPSVVRKDQASSKPPVRRWEVNESDAVERQMMSFIHACRVPGKKDCEQCIQAEPHALKDRTCTGVKNYVRNRITTHTHKMEKHFFF
ncbi:hypothetical protein UPYG_G00319630 [Umbra pygmaea]|uniref:Uncharacterized protein n=1 Tax=Umbra pygmaea TaxID=75934 RepID=A0ABD0W106_UMBPY